MTRSVDEVRNLIQHLDPAPSEAPDNLAFLNRLTTPPADPDRAADPVTVPARAMLAGRRRALGAVAAAIAIVTGLALQGVGGAPNAAAAATPAVIPLQVREPAAARLQELAVTAEAQGGQPPGPGQSWYRRSAGWVTQFAMVPGSDTETTTIPAHAVSEEWRGDDGRELRRSTYVEGIEADKVRQVSMDVRPPAELPIEDLSGQGMFEVAELARTPDDALGLAATVHSTAPEPYRTFGGIESLIGSQPLTGSQLAAIYRRLASLDGIDYRGEVHDRAGRLGAAYSVETDHHGVPEEHVLIVDPATGQPLGLETVDTRDDEVTSYVVFLESTVVPSP